MRSLVLLGLLAAAPCFAQETKFCMVDNYGNKSCNYFSMDSCRRAAANRNGACVIETTASGYGQANDPVSAFQQGQAAAAARKESAARTALLEAQAAEVRARSTQSCPTATYKCQSADGVTFYAQEPIVGCTVVTVSQ